MMIVMKEGASQQEVDAIVSKVESVGATAHVSVGELVTVIGAIGDREHVANLELDGYPGVDHVTPITKPYKLASLQIKKGERSVHDIGGRKIGGDRFMTIAGPCTVESRQVMLETAEVADVIQLGARNMQNYTLLTEVGRSGIPVLIKRGLSSKIEELLMAAEYVLKEGNDAVMLCERGIRTFETAYRFTLDLTAVPVLRQLTH